MAWAAYPALDNISGRIGVVRGTCAVDAAGMVNSCCMPANTNQGTPLDGTMSARHACDGAEMQTKRCSLFARRKRSNSSSSSSKRRGERERGRGGGILYRRGTGSALSLTLTGTASKRAGCRSWRAVWHSKDRPQKHQDAWESEQAYAWRLLFNCTAWDRDP